jgi:hypothetical protein
MACNYSHGGGSVNNLLTAIYSKTAGSALSDAVGGRMCLDEAPEGTDFPYIVFSIVSAVPEWTFTEEFANVVIQFSIFSTSQSAAEITDIYGHLVDLFDDSTFSITGSTLVWCRRQNLVTRVEDIATPSGTQIVKHWAVDFEIRTSLN